MTTAFAALSLALPAAAQEIQLTPAGVFRARDGRPAGIAGWHMDAAIAARIIAQAAARQTPFVIDYEHQTLAADKNGQPAPAAGWFKTLEWRDGAGLFATDVAWTAKAKAHIDAGEYKFISPVFAYDRSTGEVLRQEMAALTNTPALDGMAAVAALADSFFNRPTGHTPEKETRMKSVAILLGLDESASEADVSAAVAALKASAESQGAEIAALKTHTPDPAKFVPVETVNTLQADLAALTARLNQGELDEVIAAAKASGKLLPAMESWARDLGKADIAALKTYVEKVPAIAALTGNQTGGVAPGASSSELDMTDSAAIASAALKYQTGQARDGNQVTTHQAVEFVMKGA